MANENEDELENSFLKIPPRPLECGECKKTVMIRYTEIVGNSITHTSMCGDCPQLEKRLHGLTPAERASKLQGGVIACGECGTTLDALKMGTPLGCKNCYEVFGEIILSELDSLDKLTQRISVGKKNTTPIHIGRAPGEIQEINPSMRILALNEALKETLKREDYEQAAKLRDEIKALTDKNGEK
ncbi:hypothetical protein BN1013_00293 [Candidatus Rubidus massiliensis]|nr:MAG: hypothetical protein BGO10_02910 [Chlamydia sp. 32-24]CDZ79795.1 hypothetical protein BN1013_00293 [Candidatus Rubidus massiliensis]